MTVSITYNNYPVNLKVEEDFPKCKCGGKFKVQDCFNKRKIKQLTAAQCEECLEYFCDGDYESLKKSIPKAQKIRLEKLKACK